MCTAKTITLDDGSKASYTDLEAALRNDEGHKAKAAAEQRQKQRGDAGVSNG
jgi:hypothetical protein